MDYPETRDLPSYIPGYDEYLEQCAITEEDIDDMYEQYMDEYYQKLDNKFILINNTSTIREYTIPGTNIYKTERLSNGDIIATSYYKKGE